MNRAAGQGYPAARGDSSGGLGEQGRPFLPADPLIGAPDGRERRGEIPARLSPDPKKRRGQNRTFSTVQREGAAWHCHAAPSLWALFIRRRIHEGIKRGYVLSDIEILHHRTRQAPPAHFQAKSRAESGQGKQHPRYPFLHKESSFPYHSTSRRLQTALYSAAASTASITTPSAATPASGLEGAAAAAPAVCPPSGVARWRGA